MNNFRGRWFFVGLVVLLLAGGVYWYWSPWKQPAEEAEPLPEKQVTIFLLNRRKYRLEPVKRRVSEASGKSNRLEQIIDELRSKPEDSNLIRLVPKGVELRSSYVNGQTIYLDFSDELIGASRGSTGEMMLLYSIVNSVIKNMPEKYKLVQFLIEGKQRKTIGSYGEDSGHIAIQYPLGPRWNLADTSS